MFLRRLELAGFKSFADRTQLELTPGLNAVVGPNGSGKSNIADALRWVLGEQSAKQLRGGKMEDVIFAGSAHRKPLGYAEITMRIDNSDHGLPLDFSEVTVTRRVYRSGESEYAINGEQCRLKDIQMLFMDTGIGRDGYSIIGQGRVDEILSLKSEDRRHIFEEAAGIAKFKARRNEALSKLAREKENRNRVDDIIAELDEQIEPLGEQSEKARKYLALREAYKNIHINIFLDEIRRISIELEHTTKALEDSKTQSEDGKRLLSQARTASEALKARAMETDIQYRRANEILLETTTAIEQKQNEINLLEQSAAQSATDITRLKGEVIKRENGIDVKHAELSQENKNLTNAKKELEDLTAKLEDELKISAKLEAAIHEEATALNTLNQAVLQAMNAIANAHAKVLEAENIYNRLEDDKERINAEMERHEAKLNVQKSVIKEGETALTTLTTDLAQAKASEEAYTQAYTQLSNEARQIEADLRQNQESLTAIRGRYRALNALESNHEGYYKSVKSVLAKRATDPRFSGICGAVSELVSVAHEYEIAIETALGGASQNIVTRTEDDAKLAIDMLKNSKDGRATFLPLTAVRGKTIDETRLQNDVGFIGIAANLVKCDTEYAQIIGQLLGDIVIMDNLDNALALHKKYRYTYKIVTKSGERLSPGGAITGGSRQNTTGILGRSRQLEALKVQVTTLEKTVNDLLAKEQSLSQKRQTTYETLTHARERTQRLQSEAQNLQLKQTRDKEALTILRQITTQYHEENDNIMTQLIETNGLIRELKTTQAETNAHHAKARQNLEDYQRQIEENRQAATEESDTITELRIQISRRTEWIHQSEKTITRLIHEVEILNQEKDLLTREIDANQAAITQSEATQEKTLQALTNLKNHLEEARLSLTESENKKTTLEMEITQAETEARTQADAASLLDREITRLEMRKEHLDATSHRLHNEIWEEYNLTLQTAQPYKRTDISEATLRREGQRLKSELATMTDVNIGAIEAFKQLKTRHDFLTTQRDDILQAEAALDELIQSLTTQMEAQFAARFKEIAIHFQDVFKEMFNGGQAGLRLLDVDNPLESGIEITAQPPGKSLQNLMLLSGGERALTAIALLFAILRLKPSPFCVLDEIESALDDANVSRFANFLKTYANTTQFIIITHRKGTMEAADYLYGVTMEEQGISKLVSVKFVEDKAIK
ncbi:MAG: chromosome segregation protein SMC [Defluviitaleaceae bacterium]|nr:chromosome segregation protein SMC [Defluviitaleaceae bacterium]